MACCLSSDLFVIFFCDCISNIITQISYIEFIWRITPHPIVGSFVEHFLFKSLFYFNITFSKFYCRCGRRSVPLPLPKRIQQHLRTRLGVKGYSVSGFAVYVRTREHSIISRPRLDLLQNRLEPFFCSSFKF